MFECEPRRCPKFVASRIGPRRLQQLHGFLNQFAAHCVHARFRIKAVDDASSRIETGRQVSASQFARQEHEECRQVNVRGNQPKVNESKVSSCLFEPSEYSGRTLFAQTVDGDPGEIRVCTVRQAQTIDERLDEGRTFIPTRDQLAAGKSGGAGVRRCQSLQQFRNGPLHRRESSPNVEGHPRGGRVALILEPIVCRGVKWSD